MSMSKIKMLKVLDVSSNCILDGLIDYVILILENNSMLETLLLNNYYLEFLKLVKHYQVAVDNCIVLVLIANNDVDVDAASEIGAVILNSPKLEMFLARRNIFGSTGSFLIGDALSHC